MYGPALLVAGTLEAGVVLEALGGQVLLAAKAIEGPLLLECFSNHNCIINSRIRRCPTFFGRLLYRLYLIINCFMIDFQMGP
jgi:hypothetical protein